MDECVFCKILAGKLPSSIVYQDDLCTAFMDIQPVNPGHVLVIPNEHAPFLVDLPEQTGAYMFPIAQRLAAALRASGVKCEGVNFFLADGEAALQDVFHVHLHIIPRYEGDGFGLQLPPDYSTRPERVELDQIAEDLLHILDHS